MNKVFRYLCVSVVAAVTILATSCNKQEAYESVKDDPMQSRIYTLPNGLKVYMTVNKELPRIQTYIAVRVGGKNDPDETTGLAHYFEHLMFKGTKSFGTMNYQAEEPLLNAIEDQFEIYRKTTDEAERAQIYHVIDSLSYEASKYSIPNEYDKLMAAIGAENTNAFTSYDMTCYQEDIPSNEIENWAKIQSDRFKNAVIRGFHTELETVYEEKNMSLTRDIDKVIEAIFSSLYKKHPYGTHTVLGTQHDLKNPSITNIKNYYKTWYVPNNIAICLSGDFDPDQMYATIVKYFGDMQPNPELPKLNLPQEDSITAPINRDVIGVEAEYVALAWRFPGAASQEAEMLDVVGNILYNGQAGLIDLDLAQQQKLMAGYACPYAMSDYSTLIMMGYPKPGQTLDETKDLLLAEIAKLRNGDFDEDILKATINNYKLSQMQELESNESRAMKFVDAFINGTQWSDEVAMLDRVEKLTKADLVAFANKYLKDSNFVTVYKRQGVDPNEVKMTKPAITPIAMNRDTVSNFLKEIKSAEVQPIEPVFLDYAKDLSQFETANGIPVLYKQNTTNDLFSLTYLFDMGNNSDKYLGLAAQYGSFLGTSDMTPEQIKSAFYEMACSFQVYPGDRRTYVVLEGLNENMPKAMALFEKLLADAQVNEEAYRNMVMNILQGRYVEKSNQKSNFSKLRNYIKYGPAAVKNELSQQELMTTNPQSLVDRIHQLSSYKHRILYYGPSTKEALLDVIAKEHHVADTLTDCPASDNPQEQLTTETKIFIAPYSAKQIYMAQYSNNGDKYDYTSEPSRQLYNEYFGGGMNSIVFQEMREARGLAYSAWAGLGAPGYKDENYVMQSFIASQNDKMMDAVNTFNDIINNMPVSEAAFALAKDGMIARLRSNRITRSDVLWDFVNAQEFGIKEDVRKEVFEKVQNMTLQDVIDYQQKKIKGRSYYYGILGDKNDLNLKELQKIGTIVNVSQEEIFGY